MFVPEDVTQTVTVWRPRSSRALWPLITIYEVEHRGIKSYVTVGGNGTGRNAVDFGIDRSVVDALILRHKEIGNKVEGEFS